MKERIIKLIGNSLDELNLTIDDVVLEKEGNVNYLRIVLDSNEIIDMDKVTKATGIINPLLDKDDIINDVDYLDIYGKSKGSEE